MVVFFHGGQQEYLRTHVDFFLVNVPTYRPGREPRPRVMALDRRLAELTCYFTFFSYQLPLRHMRFAASLDGALAASTKDYCLIQNAGHIFYGQDQLSIDLKAELERCAFLTGTVVHDSAYHALNPSCILVNRRAWEQLGRPAFGAPHRGREAVALPQSGSTPTHLDPAGQQSAVETHFGYGWNAISASLAAGLPVAAWPDQMRRWMIDHDPYAGNVAEWIMDLDDVMNAPKPEDGELASMLAFLTKTPDPVGSAKSVFVYNSEAYADIPNLRYRPGLDSAFVLASGFKANRMLENFGFHDNTHVIVYDYSAPAVALRRMMVEEWNGTDFGRFMTAARERLAKMFPERIVFHPGEITASPEKVEAEFQSEISAAFHTPERWLAHWQRYRTLKHSFVPADILQPEPARDLISKYAKGHALIWISDIFNSPNAVGKLSWERRKLAYDTILESLAAAATTDVVIGAAPGLWLVS
ncbi:MAG: hypothetical protein EPO08_06215 [Rhodospirillaceae bacterium]|nr:MAG: hypothetical protein EPO08_06215 [Rhodospirillaceae bacterium]